MLHSDNTWVGVACQLLDETPTDYAEKVMNQAEDTAAPMEIVTTNGEVALLHHLRSTLR